MSRLQDRHDDLRRRQADRMMRSHFAKRSGDKVEADRQMTIAMRLLRKRNAVIDKAIRKGHDMADWP